MAKPKIKQHRPPAKPLIEPARTGRRGKTVMVAVLIAMGVAMVLALILVPGSPPSVMTASAKPDHGEALFKQYCVACHGAKGIGEFNWQSRERGAPALDSSGHAWHHEDAQLISMILDKPVPDSKMPAWRNVLSQEDTLDVLAYIKTLWTPFIRENCQGARHMNMQCGGMR